jgi:hypothetical protein
MIDRATVSLYGCCKCNHKWIAGWDAVNNREHPVPNYCPKCKNLRWNQTYTKEEESLYNKLVEEHTVNQTTETGEYDMLVERMTGRHSTTTFINLDPVAYLFLYDAVPQPDYFELKQVHEIPKSDREKRHEAMLSIVGDRIKNAAKYEQERFSKWKGEWFEDMKQSAWMNSKEGHLSIRPSKIDNKHCKHANKHKLLSKQLENVQKKRKEKYRKKSEAEYRQRRLQYEEEERKHREQAEEWTKQYEERSRIRELKEKAEELEKLEMEINKAT